MSEDLTLATLAVPDDPESDEDQEPSLVWGRLIPLQRDLPDICKSSFLSLHGFRHPQINRSHFIALQETEVTLGRSKECTFVISGRKISSEHCKITKVPCVLQSFGCCCAF